MLGLSHSSQITSIMYAIYHQSHVNPDKEFELTWDDRKAVQKAYGKEFLIFFFKLSSSYILHMVYSSYG